jgi:hypothetical protein
MSEDKVKQLLSVVVAFLFVVCSFLGIPVEQIKMPTTKQTRLGVSDECEDEIKELPVMGVLSDECEKEATVLHKKLHNIERASKEGKEK